MIDDTVVWGLLRAVVADGNAAWPALAAALEPELAGMARRQPIGRLRDLDDSPREIVIRVLERLYSRDFATIRKLCTLEPPPVLAAWFSVLVRRSAIDYMRETPEYQRGAVDKSNRWVSLATLSSTSFAATPDSLAAKALEVLTFVRTAVKQARAESAEHGDDAVGRLSIAWKVERVHVRRLIAKGDQFVAVLADVLEGSSYPTIAERRGITKREVELSVRYIEELLHARGFAS